MDQSGEESTNRKVQSIPKSSDTVTATTLQQSTASSEHPSQATPSSDDRASIHSRKNPPVINTDVTPETSAASPLTPDEQQRAQQQRPRQVIAVSANKGPAAFFNLARKFLVTDEMCDLSALEGAIVSAADAAHLLERSKLATIVRVQTSYVSVEPKRRRQVPSHATSHQPIEGMASIPQQPQPFQHQYIHSDVAFSPAATSVEQSTLDTRASPAGRELRRARIVITVKRTSSYKQWLDDNPLQAAITGDGDDDDDVDVDVDSHNDLDVTEAILPLQNR